MAGPEYQILCHSIGALSFLLACVFIVTGICLQVFDPAEEANSVLTWRTDGIILTCIGGAALLVFVFYFCHVARRHWKIFNVISITSYSRKRKSTAVSAGDWHVKEETSGAPGRSRTTTEKSQEPERIDGITPAEAYSREFSFEDETESSTSGHSNKRLVNGKRPASKQRRKYKLPRQISEHSDEDEANSMQVVPFKRKRSSEKRSRPTSKRKSDGRGSQRSSIKDYVIRSSKRYSVNEAKRDERIESKAKADRELMDSLGKGQSQVNEEANRNSTAGDNIVHNDAGDSDNYVIVPARKSFRKNTSVYSNGSIPSQGYEPSGTDNKAFNNEPSNSIEAAAADSKKYPNGILKKTAQPESSEMVRYDDDYNIQSKRQRKFQKRASGALRHSSQKVNTGVDETSLDKPIWVTGTK